MIPPGPPPPPPPPLPPSGSAATPADSAATPAGTGSAPTTRSLTPVQGCYFHLERYQEPQGPIYRLATQDAHRHAGHRANYTNCWRCFQPKHGAWKECQGICGFCNTAGHIGHWCPIMYGTARTLNRHTTVTQTKVPRYLQVEPGPTEQDALVAAGYLSRRSDPGQPLYWNLAALVKFQRYTRLQPPAGPPSSGMPPAPAPAPAPAPVPATPGLTIPPPPPANPGGYYSWHGTGYQWVVAAASGAEPQFAQLQSVVASAPTSNSGQASKKRTLVEEGAEQDGSRKSAKTGSQQTALQQADQRVDQLSQQVILMAQELAELRQHVAQMEAERPAVLPAQAGDAAIRDAPPAVVQAERPAVLTAQAGDAAMRDADPAVTDSNRLLDIGWVGQDLDRALDEEIARSKRSEGFRRDEA